MFENEFIDSIPENPIVSCGDIIEKTLGQLEFATEEYSPKEYEVLLTGLSLLLSVSENFDIQINSQDPVLNGEQQNDSMEIEKFIKSVKKEIQTKVVLSRINTMKGQFDNSLNQGFAYEFSQDDIDRVQVLINELREQVSSSSLFEEDHKRRLLKRLEQLQSEIHKRMSDIDRFWGLVGDAGVVIGKFGKDSKPFVDRIKEIAGIAWKTQSKAEELPSDSPSPLQIDDKND